MQRNVSSVECHCGVCVCVHLCVTGTNLVTGDNLRGAPLLGFV